MQIHLIKNLIVSLLWEQLLQKSLIQNMKWSDLLPRFLEDKAPGGQCEPRGWGYLLAGRSQGNWAPLFIMSDLSWCISVPHVGRAAAEGSCKTWWDLGSADNHITVSWNRFPITLSFFTCRNRQLQSNQSQQATGFGWSVELWLSLRWG